LKPALLACLALLAGCAASENPNTLTQVQFASIPGWSTDATDQAFTQFRRECTRLATLPPAEQLGGIGEAAQRAGTPAAYEQACLAARQVLVSSAADARTFFAHWFAAYDAGAVPVSGYFEPEFPGSLSQTGAYQIPVLARPADLVTIPDGDTTLSGRNQNGRIVPYPTRAAIDHGALAGRGLELLWLSDPIDLFFLQLQGSGRIRLPSGQLVRVAYAGKNGQPYVPLGRLMIERGLLAPEDATPQHIHDWLESHPAQATALIEQNPNYVFFRLLDGVSLDEGAPGALGVPLTPLRSVAVDRAIVPLATPVFYDVTGSPLRGLAFATDVSGSRGEGLDIFFGWGKAAQAQADTLHGTAHRTLLLPRPVAPPR
jgi:membrane-bound lytic murein transglycosylase A